MARLVVRPNLLAKHRRHRPHLATDESLARHMEMHPSQISRVLRGVTEPGTRFIAGLHLAFGDDAHHLYSAVPDEKEK